MRWKNFGQTTTEEGHKVFFCGKEDKHEHGVGFLAHCHGMSPSLQQAHYHPPEGSPSQYRIMMTTKQKNSMTSYIMSLTRHRRRTFLLCKETGMLKWTRMLAKTGKAFVGPSATTTQMREDSDFWSLPPLTILCWRTLLVITKYPEDGGKSPLIYPLHHISGKDPDRRLRRSRRHCQHWRRSNHQSPFC